MMDENLKNLEIEIEEELTAIFSDAASPILDEVLTRTKLAVRHALDEQWFADQEKTSIPANVVAQVKSAVRSELKRDKTVVPARSYTARFISFMSAAAAIVLFIGVMQYAGSLRSKPSLSRDTLAEPLDLFVKAAESTSDESMLTTIESDLDAIEESIAQWPRESGDGGLDEYEIAPNSDSHERSRDSTS